MKAVIIKGNAKYITTERAKAYYREIEDFLVSLGVDVEFDDGADYTCPPQADFYVAHSKGCSRIRCFKGGPKEKDFLMFGDPNGYIHPDDLKWQKANPPKEGQFNPPPREHYMFIDSQKKAIVNKVRELSVKHEQPVSRQNPMSRPRVRH